MKLLSITFLTSSTFFSSPSANFIKIDNGFETPIAYANWIKHLSETPAETMSQDMEISEDSAENESELDNYKLQQSTDENEIEEESPFDNMSLSDSADEEFERYLLKYFKAKLELILLLFLDLNLLNAE